MVHGCDTNSSDTHGGSIQPEECFIFSISVEEEEEQEVPPDEPEPTCTGGDGLTYPKSLLDDDIDKFCEDLVQGTLRLLSGMTTSTHGDLQRYMEFRNKEDCDEAPHKMSFEDCQKYLAKIVHGCGTNSSETHGGMLDLGNCATFQIIVYEPDPS